MPRKRRIIVLGEMRHVIGVAETGRYLGISGPATSICLREGEKLIVAREGLKAEIESNARDGDALLL